MGENKYLEQARKELEYLSGAPDFKRLLESRAGFLRDEATQMAEARKEGKKRKKEGREEEQLKIAKKMKDRNIPIEEIINLTELTKEEIQEL